METNLFLGRFLNEALNTVPDIDLDFPRNIREELILAVYEKYGSDHAGLVCTFPTYRLRSAVREIGKSLELPMGDLEKLTKLAERRNAGGLKEELETLPVLADTLAHSDGDTVIVQVVWENLHPLLVTAEDSAVPIFDTTELHAVAAAEAALADG